MANWLDKYNMNSNVAKTDATRVATPNLKLTKAQLDKNKAINKEVMAKTNKAKAEEIARRTAARNKPGKTISEVFTNKEPYNIQERFRLFPNDTEYGQVFDEYFNPVYFTAQMASDLANSLQSGDYKGAATTAGLALGVGALGFDPLGSAMKVPGKVAQSMESGLLSNTYKLNPWAFKPNPEAYYHRSPNLENVINKETGMLQGFGQSEAGKVYSANNAVTPTGTTINLKRGANSQLYFAKGTPLDFGRYNPSGQGYKGPYLIEAEGIPMGMSTKGSTPSVNPPTALGSYAVSHRPISANEVKFYKENWLQGYKPIEVPKFESEINWGKWNKEIPGNKSLMQEYKAIEQTSKANGTWMKNADGSAFEGTPEQFVQQQSSNFKKAFPQGVTKFYRGSNQHIDDFVNRQRADWALFGSDNPNVAKAYANTTEGPVNFYTPETSTEWGEKGLYELAFPNEAKIIEGQGGGRDFGLLDYNEQVAKGTRNPRMADVHNENLQYNWNNGNQYEYTAKMYDPAKRYLDTDSYANYVKNTNNPETVARIKNVIDGPKDLSSTVYAIDAERLPIKSLRYNNGMFDLTNPNIYKSVAPIIGAGVAASQFVDQKKNGGWLEKYDDGGPVNGWTTSAAGTAYNKAARQQPTNIDANAMQAVGQVTSYPQRKVTEWITGKNQYPSQAMGIQNPYGAFAVDAVLDPTNLVGVGLLGKAAKASSKAAKVAKVVANSGPNDLVSVMKGAGKKFLDTFVDPIKYKKDIEALKAVHSNLPNYINSPEITERLKNLGITNPSELTYPNLTFSRQGSYFDNLGNKINIDLSEPARYSNTHQFTHRGIYDHEIGHWLQREAYTKGGGYEKDFANFNDEFNKYKSKRDVWTQEHSNPYTIEAIASEPELPSLFPPLPIAKPTVVDDELIRRIVPNIKSRVGQKNYDYFKADRLEAYPFMRETRREMIDQGYLPNEIANVNPSVVTNFLKANPKNRISSFSKPEFSTGLYLSSMMNKFPALAPVLGAGAIATATQEYNDGGPIQPNYNDASVSMSKDFVGDGYSNVGRNYSPAWGGQFEDGGEIPTDKKSQEFYNTLKDYYTSPDRTLVEKAKYAAFNQLNEKYGYAPVRVADRTIMGKRSMINPFTGRLNLVVPEDPEVGEIKPVPEKLIDKYMTEYGHYQQYNQNPEESKLKKSGKFLGHMFTDFGNMLKNTKGFNFTEAYEKNYETPGTIEHEAHNVIQPKLEEELLNLGRQNFKNRYSMAMGGSMPQFQPGGKTPIIVNDKNDPRLKAYNDSLTLHNKGKSYLKQGFSQQLYDYAQDLILYGKNKKIAPYKTEKGKSELFIPQYKKPTQPVVYEKPKPQIQPTSQAVIDWIEGNIKDENAPTRLGTSEDEKKYAMGGSMPGAVGFTYARVAGSAPSNGPYAKKTKASAEDGARIKENVKTVYSGMLPEITVVGSKDPQTEEYYRGMMDRLSKEEGIRQGLILTSDDDVDIAFDDPISTNNILGRYQGLMDLGKKYGFPKVHPIDPNSIFAVAENLAEGEPSLVGPPANYNPFTKTIQAKSSNNWVSELAHHVQFKNKPISTGFKFLTNDIPAYISGKSPYIKPGTMEHEAHSIIEPKLEEEIEVSKRKYKQLPYIQKLIEQFYGPIENYQNGGEMKYYQEGLDFKPKTISKNGSELKKLDQLTNFTNYNPTKPSGWLEKYQ